MFNNTAEKIVSINNSIERISAEFFNLTGEKLTVKKAQEVVGTIADGNSKILGSTFSLPAQLCQTGSKLAKIEGSVCSNCYALSGFYNMPSVKKSLALNHVLISSVLNKTTDSRLYVLAYAFLVAKTALKKAKKEQEGFDLHRVFASGDFINERHVSLYNSIASLLPAVMFWIPTKEKGHVSRFQAFMHEIGETMQPNMVIRVSYAMVDHSVIATDSATPHSIVVSDWSKAPRHAFWCSAQLSENGACNDCRECWNGENKLIAYKQH